MKLTRNQANLLALALENVTIKPELKSETKMALIQNKVAVNIEVETVHKFVEKTKKAGAGNTAETNQIIEDFGYKTIEVEILTIPREEFLLLIDNQSLNMASALYRFIVAKKLT